MRKIPAPRPIVWRIVAPAAVLIAGCAGTDESPNPPMTPSDRASLQNECAQIADRSERDACIERAAFSETW